MLTNQICCHFKKQLSTNVFISYCDHTCAKKFRINILTTFTTFYLIHLSSAINEHKCTSSQHLFDFIHTELSGIYAYNCAIDSNPSVVRYGLYDT